MTPADRLAEAVEALLLTGPCSDPDCCKTAIEHENATVALRDALTAFRAARDDGYHVTIQGQYDADSHCVVTEHGEALVAFETDAGSLAPLDGKAVTVTVRAD